MDRVELVQCPPADTTARQPDCTSGSGNLTEIVSNISAANPRCRGVESIPDRPHDSNAASPRSDDRTSDRPPHDRSPHARSMPVRAASHRARAGRSCCQAASSACCRRSSTKRSISARSASSSSGERRPVPAVAGSGRSTSVSVGTRCGGGERVIAAFRGVAAPSCSHLVALDRVAAARVVTPALPAGVALALVGADDLDQPLESCRAPEQARRRD